MKFLRSYLPMLSLVIQNVDRYLVGVCMDVLNIIMNVHQCSVKKFIIMNQ